MNGFALFWIALIAAAIAARPVFYILLALKSRQTIDPHAPASHQVKQGTPTMGGIITVLGILVGLIAALISGGPDRPVFASAILLLIGFTAIGFVDDFVVPRLIKGKRGLGWKQKIILQVVIAAVSLLPLQGVNILSLAIGIFVVLFAANAYNFADGLDGLAGSIALAFCAGVVGLSTLAGSGAGAIGLIIAAAIIPFLFLNAHPAKIFMGDVGSLPIGALFGLVSLVLPASTMARPGVAGPSPELMTLAVLVLNGMLMAELLPVPIQVFYYKRTGKRIFPATPIHHGFEKKGWPETRIVPAFALVQLLLSILAITIVLGLKA